MLTGGQSTRMGADKATLFVGGRPMAVRVSDALWEAGCHPVICQGGDAAALRAFGLDARPDSVTGAGPAVAIRDGLRAIAGDAVVAACDLVDLDGASVRRLIGAIGGHDVAVAAAGGRRHLLAFIRARAASAIESGIEKGVTSYLDLLDRLDAVDVDVDPSAVRNVNRPDDLEPSDDGR